MQDSGTFSTDSEQSEAHVTLPPVDPNTQGKSYNKNGSNNIIGTSSSTNSSNRSIMLSVF